MEIDTRTSESLLLGHFGTLAKRLTVMYYSMIMLEVLVLALQWHEQACQLESGVKV